MSSTVSPASDSGAAKTNKQELAARDKVLKIGVTGVGNERGDFKVFLKELAGKCPIDRPFWSNHTETNFDSRGMPPQSLRYICNKATPSQVNESAIRRAIWREVRQLIDDNDDDDEAAPAVMIDQRSNKTGDSCAIVDLVFTTHRPVTVVPNELKQLEVQQRNGDSICYRYKLATNSLGGNILVLECLRLPIDEAFDTQELFAAFSDMAAGVGKVLGIADLITESKEWNVRARAGVSRAYVKIYERNMAIDWSELVHKLPTHFVWHGFPYTLRFPGSGLLKGDVFSSSYPTGAAEAAGEGADVASSSKRPRTSNGDLTSDSTAAKRPRSSEK